MKKIDPFRELFYISLKKTLLIMSIAIIPVFPGIKQAIAIDAYSQKAWLSLGISEATFAESKYLPGTDLFNKKETRSAKIMQQLVVTGTVSDSQTGEAMPGVNIQVKGSTIGAISDANGRYSLSVPNRDATLIFSFVGYVAQEIPLNGRASLDVAIVTELRGLDEVIVVGYGIQKKRETGFARHHCF